jgi:hypothetical protein
MRVQVQGTERAPEALLRAAEEADFHRDAHLELWQDGSGWWHADLVTVAPVGGAEPVHRLGRTHAVAGTSPIG